MTTRHFLRLPPSALIAMGVVSCVPARADEQRASPAAPRPVATTWCADHCDGVISDYSLPAFQVIKAADGYHDPMSASRSLAMMHLAMHDAVNAVNPRYQRYALAAVPPRTNGSDPRSRRRSRRTTCSLRCTRKPRPQPSSRPNSRGRCSTRASAPPSTRASGSAGRRQGGPLDSRRRDLRPGAAARG
jgi:hypothetical protein